MPRLTKVEIQAARKAGLVRQGAYLRRLRAGTGLTQRELAKLLDVDEAMIQHWERGRNPVGLEHQAGLADALRVRMDVLVLRLSLFTNPLLSAVVWRTSGQPSSAPCCHACP